MSRIVAFIRARYRAFAPISCLKSPRPDILSGYARWKWLYKKRKAGLLIDPSIEIRYDHCSLAELDDRLVLMKGCSVDKDCIVWLGNEQESKGEIHIGEMAYIGPGSFIGSCHKLQIGNNAMVGAGCYIITANHKTASTRTSYNKQGYTGADIIIGDNAWLGCHVVVLPGVTIGDNAIVGAGAVVPKSIPPGETWAGVPARKIKE